ncbi:MAG: Gfo/Idh/MocA family protein [Spirochaetia bacterium]
MNLKICVIGCGGIAKNYHGPSLVRYQEERGGIELAGCCDTDAVKAEDFRKNFGFSSSWENMNEMIDRIDPDGLLLLLPPKDTAKHAEKILRRRIPSLIEKPPGMTRDETERLAAAARQTDTFAMTAFNRRFMPTAVEAKSAISSVGIRLIRYTFTRANRLDPDFTTTCIHGIDTLRFLSGSDYRFLEFQYREYPDNPGVYDIFARGEMISGCPAELVFFPLSGTVTERCEIYQQNRNIYVNLPVWNNIDSPGIIRMLTPDDYQEIAGSRKTDEITLNGFFGEVSSFLDIVKGVCSPEDFEGSVCTLSSSVQPVEIAQAMRERRKSWQN